MMKPSRSVCVPAHICQDGSEEREPHRDASKGTFLYLSWRRQTIEKKEGGREKNGQAGEPSSVLCPLSCVQPALLIHQVVSSLSAHGDRRVRPLAQGPARSAYINTSAAFVLVLTPCFTAQANSRTAHLCPVPNQSNRDVAVPCHQRGLFCFCSPERSVITRDKQKKGGTQVNSSGKLEENLKKHQVLITQSVCK